MKTRIALAIALAGFAATASATGLQVSPTTAVIRGQQAALWLFDSGTSPVHAQVRVYRWTQAGGKDSLVPSQDLVVSPPMAAIAPGKKQLVRVIRTIAPPTSSETAYRLAVDELPIAGPHGAGLHFIVHYSVPVFIEPAGAKNLAPVLRWSVQGRDLVVSNSGTRHAQLAAVRIGGVTVAKGLLGYVLPGSTMRWRMPRVVGNATTATAEINGYFKTFPLAAGNPASASARQ